MNRIESWMAPNIDHGIDSYRNLNEIRKDLQQAQKDHNELLDLCHEYEREVDLVRQVYDDYMEEHRDCVARMLIDEVVALIDKG